jgi:tetratricopeptide (TPR) repeat protein
MLDELEDYEKLISALSDYINSDQTAGAAVRNRALAYWEIGAPERALADFDLAATLLPESHMPCQLKGMLLQKLDRLDEALVAFNNAVSISPDQATTRRARAFLLIDLGRLEDALRDFDHAIALEPAFAKTREDRESVLSRLAANDQSGRSQKQSWHLWCE